MTDTHDCGYPPGDKTNDLGFTRTCSECGEEWYCFHPRLGLWMKTRDRITPVGEHVQRMSTNPDWVAALELPDPEPYPPYDD